MEAKPDKCAPSKKFEEGSCLTLESLKKIANKYNQINSDKIKITDNKKDLVKQLNESFSKKHNCNKQTCWLRSQEVKSLNDPEILENSFRPNGPKGKYDWLSTSDINKVVEQYETVYPDFLFLGAVPNDFEELSLKYNDQPCFNCFDDYINKGKTKLGMVINLDTSDKGGSHWVALYFDFNKNQIYYFDSVGKPPGKRIRRYNNKILKYMYKRKYGEELDINSIKKDKKIPDNLDNFDVTYNGIQHQFDDSECGVYSINFILRLAKGESFKEITENITKDEKMNECRKVYFNNT
jgi:hypothetical protein